MHHHAYSCPFPEGCNCGASGAEAAEARIADLERENGRVCDEVIRLRTALNQIAYPATYGTEGKDPRIIAAAALRVG